MDLCDYDFSCRRPMFCEIHYSKQERFDLAIIQKLLTITSYHKIFILLSGGVKILIINILQHQFSLTGNKIAHTGKQ